MGKRRNTAKTGDKALYKSRPTVSGGSGKKNKDDDMYTEVDQYHNRKDEEFMKLDHDDTESEDEQKYEAVMDLGVGGSSDEDSDDDGDSDDDKEKMDQGKGEESEDDDSSEDGNVSVSSSSDEEEPMEDVRNWGRNKTSYYNGDTADLEIGQETEDAFLEEEAAKEVQRARYEDMSDDDFDMSDNEGEEKKDDDDDEDEGKIISIRDPSKLSTKQKRRFVDKQHPEMLPLVSHFADITSDLTKTTKVAANAIYEDPQAAKAVGMTKQGKRYLLTKELLQSSAALNLTMYMLLKLDSLHDDETADSSQIQSHPVMSRLQKLNSLMGKLEDKVETVVPGLGEQLSNLAKAAKLMERSGKESNEVVDDQVADDDASEAVSDDDENDATEPSHTAPMDEASSDDDDESSQGSAAEKRRVQTEARFGLRPSEVHQEGPKARQRRPVDFGDDGAADEATRAAARKSLASTLNTIEQKARSSSKSKMSWADGLDDTHQEDDAARRGLAMMEEELGKDFDKFSDEDDAAAAQSEPDDDDDFYNRVARKNKANKEDRKARYAVAPKFPRGEQMVEGERAISRQIMKNRGLVAHKSKLNRNPRVKKRVQYQKAIVRRKGAVRDIRTDEAHKYGGETTGIKSRLSRSRKLG